LLAQQPLHELAVHWQLPPLHSCPAAHGGPPPQPPRSGVPSSSAEERSRPTARSGGTLASAVARSPAPISTGGGRLRSGTARSTGLAISIGTAESILRAISFWPPRSPACDGLPQPAMPATRNSTPPERDLRMIHDNGGGAKSTDKRRRAD
jgi:hypothetical protein